MPRTGATSRERALSPIAILILTALTDAPRHGYAIKQEVERATGGAIRLGPASLYETIQRLEVGGLLAETDRRPRSTADKAQRRYYVLTRSGRAALTAEVRRLGWIVDHARTKLGLEKPEPV